MITYSKRKPAIIYVYLEVQRKMEAKLSSMSKTHVTKDQTEILQNAAPGEGTHLPTALTLYFDFVEKREQQRIEKVLHAKKQLPIYKHKEEIVQLVKDHQVSIKYQVILLTGLRS